MVRRGHGGLRQTTLNANLEVASHPLQAACKALVNSDCRLCFGWTPLYSTSWMIQPCRSWQWTRRSALHPHRRPRLMQSPFTLRLFRAARNDAFNRIMNLGAIGAEGSSFLSERPKAQYVEQKRPLRLTAKQIFNGIFCECEGSHSGYLTSTVDHDAMHIQVERAIHTWLVKDWRHTPYASLITLYANHFIGSAPRTLLHTDPTVILVRNIFGSASKDSWPARSPNERQKS